MHNTLIKDRLETQLSKPDSAIVKQALFSYLSKTDPGVARTKFENISLEVLLPDLQEMSPLWNTMTVEDFVTSYPAINSVYHIVRNQFKYLETLRKRVDEFIEQNGTEEDENQSYKGKQQILTRGQERLKRHLVSSKKEDHQSQTLHPTRSRRLQTNSLKT